MDHELISNKNDLSALLQVLANKAEIASRPQNPLIPLDLTASTWAIIDLRRLSAAGVRTQSLDALRDEFKLSEDAAVTPLLQVVLQARVLSLPMRTLWAGYPPDERIRTAIQQLSHGRKYQFVIAKEGLWTKDSACLLSAADITADVELLLK